MTPAVRPSVTDDARAEAARRWGDRRTSDRLPVDWLDEGMASGFVLGAQWAAARAETTTEATERIARQIAATSAMTGGDALDLVEAVQALQNAETTTLSNPGSVTRNAPNVERGIHMNENSTKMLATPDALYAAHSALDAEYGSHCAQPSECFVCDTHTSVGLIVEAAAPPIAAATLRDAADWLDDMARGHRETAYLGAGRDLISRLRARADELEADRGGQSWETGAMSDYAKEEK